MNKQQTNKQSSPFKITDVGRTRQDIHKFTRVPYKGPAVAVDLPSESEGRNSNERGENADYQEEEENKGEELN